MISIEWAVNGLNRRRAEQFEIVAKAAGAATADSWPGRAVVTVPDEKAGERVAAELRQVGFEVSALGQLTDEATLTVAVQGMTCRSCEFNIERKFKKVPGVLAVHADHASGMATLRLKSGVRLDLADLDRAVSDSGYRVLGDSGISGERPSWWRLIALFAAVGLLAEFFGRFGWLARFGNIGNEVGFVAALGVGLVAGMSSCLAVSGGMLIASVGRKKTGQHPFWPTAAFVGGRIMSYSLLGGAIGALGRSLTLPVSFSGLLVAFASVMMVIVGLQMLGLAPGWLRRLVPSLPKSVGRFVTGSKAEAAGPALLGAMTFFLPCGFTAALQVYALASGGFWPGAIALGGFAIGSAPALIALGLATAAPGPAGKWLKQFAGALAIVLGLASTGNGLAVAGFDVPTWSSLAQALGPANVAPAAAGGSAALTDANVKTENGKQVIRLALIDSPPYYSPADNFKVKVNVPVRMEISGQGYGCRGLLQVSQYGARVQLNKSLNVLEFTPTAVGRATFSCAMGMYRGLLEVVP